MRCGERLLNINKPLILGILNVTPDSFYAESRSFSEEEVLAKAELLLSEGASIIDVGAYSSRPGANDVSEEEEFRRLDMAIGLIRKLSPHICISVDTFRASIVQKIFDKYGAFIVNDISGGELDKQMFETVAELRLPYILMHMKGNPQTMQHKPEYDDVVAEVLSYFSKKLDILRSLGIADVIIDPGFGFGKTMEHNYELLARLDELHVLGRPILIGLSRKSMLYKLLNITSDEALNATSVVHTVGLMKGASFLRVHDVAAADQVVRLLSKVGIWNEGNAK